VQPYEIHVAQQTLEETRDRLRSIRWSATLAGNRGRYGVSLPELRKILDFWAEDYSWRTWEQKLNAQPHFLATVDRVELHFWRIAGAKPDSIPLLLLHGWPGSAVEFWNLIGPLTDPVAYGAPDAPSFDVVIAELPGFGFSGKPVEPGWGPTRMADALHTLMHEVLGYPRYAVHGEDWGSIIGARIARRHTEEVAALQITMPYADPHGEFASTPERIEWEGRMYAALGYDHVQSQVPDALTLGMVDSPLALAAWVLEKFWAWSDNKGTLSSTFDLDILVTNLNFYWLTSSIITSTRIYRESALEGGDVMGPPRIPVPAGIAVFPKEPFGAPREWLDGVYDIRRYNTFNSGGHFAALEQPETVLSEIREFFPTFIGTAK
jgi:microsomal epoxide hydrolase